MRFDKEKLKFSISFFTFFGSLIASVISLFQCKWNRKEKISNAKSAIERKVEKKKILFQLEEKSIHRFCHTLLQAIRIQRGKISNFFFRQSFFFFIFASPVSISVRK